MTHSDVIIIVQLHHHRSYTKMDPISTFGQILSFVLFLDLSCLFIVILTIRIVFGSYIIG